MESNSPKQKVAYPWDSCCHAYPSFLIRMMDTAASTTEKQALLVRVDVRKACNNNNGKYPAQPLGRKCRLSQFSVLGDKGRECMKPPKLEAETQLS